jgi:hypothetical protein
MALLQRKCACGGGCPRCQTDSVENNLLKINEPTSAEEQEAEQVATQVMRTPTAYGQVSSQRLAASSVPAKSALESYLQRRSGSGSPLPDGVRSFMEPRFGLDLSEVRVHTDQESMILNKGLNAQAFTYNQHIYFGTGKSPSNDSLTAHELAHFAQQNCSDKKHNLFRKISVENFDQPIQNPTARGISQTHGETVFDYFSLLCPDADFIMLDGQLSLLDESFCSVTQLTPDGLSSKAELSKTSTSCTCLCDVISAPDDIKISVDDSKPANTHYEKDGGKITVPSPNNTKIPSVQSASGSLITSSPSIVLAHELCGHYWLHMHGENEQERVTFYDRGGHDPAINRENLIRKEHGQALRATFRDPCCGLGNPTPADLAKPRNRCGSDFDKALHNRDTLVFECNHWREEYNRLNGTNFTTDDRIPELQGEKLPAQWRVEITFHKDAPQPWQTLAQSLTSDGQERLEFVLTALSHHPDMSVQLTGNASSDKPVNDPTYNQRLAQRRALFVQNELKQKGVIDQRFKTFDETCTQLQAGIHNCGDLNSKSLIDAKERNVEVKIFHP